MHTLDTATDRVLIDELKSRGYDVLQVYNTKHEALESASDQELLGELYERGHNLIEQDKFKDFLFEIYYECVWKTPEAALKAMNKYFIKELNKWL